MTSTDYKNVFDNTSLVMGYLFFYECRASVVKWSLPSNFFTHIKDNEIILMMSLSISVGQFCYIRLNIIKPKQD